MCSGEQEEVKRRKGARGSQAEGDEQNHVGERELEKEEDAKRNTVGQAAAWKFGGMQKKRTEATHRTGNRRSILLKMEKRLYEKKLMNCRKKLWAEWIRKLSSGRIEGNWTTTFVGRGGQPKFVEKQVTEIFPGQRKEAFREEHKHQHWK